jgi:AraC-like DNA-binding protein
MKDRCLNEKNSAYPDYGGRGIKVCDRWLNSFDNFLEDMGPRPTLRHTLDREDNDGSYEPGNCRWATKKEQANNNRRNVVVEFQGQKMTATQLAEKFGFSPITVLYRINSGLTAEQAIRPLFAAKQYEHDGLSLSLYAWGKRVGIHYVTLMQRIASGMSIADALTKTVAKTGGDMRTYNGFTKSVSEWARHAGMSVSTLTTRLRKGMTIEDALLTPVQKKKPSGSEEL